MTLPATAGGDAPAPCSHHGNRGGGIVAPLLCLVVFSLHNGFNCFVFLNYVNYAPARALLNATDSEVGFVNTAGWIGILSGIPLVTVCRWHRTLLFLAGAAQCAAPVARYLGAASVPVAVATQLMVGAAFGVIGAWPAMLARLQWPRHRRTLVTAIAALSNYVVGSLGTAIMPSIASTGPALHQVFFAQCFIAAFLFVAMVAWLWIPPLKLCLVTGGGGWAGVQVLIFGLAVGVSLLLQGMNQFLLAEFGFTDFEAGMGNTVYQLTAALVGVILGGRVTHPRDLRSVIRGMHAVAAVASTGLGLLCWAGLTHGRYRGAVPAMIAVMVLLGGSLMGMLPFLLQQAVHTVAPASENVVAALIYLVAMSIAAGLTSVTSSVSPTTAMTIVAGLAVAEQFMFLTLDPQGRAPCCRTAAMRRKYKAAAAAAAAAAGGGGGEGGAAAPGAGEGGASPDGGMAADGGDRSKLDPRDSVFSWTSDPPVPSPALSWTSDPMSSPPWSPAISGEAAAAAPPLPPRAPMSATA
eukprot:g338.t1